LSRGGWPRRQIAPPSDWSDWIHICGFFFLDNPNPDWKADPALLEFLADRSKKIVYIGFGSIVVDDPGTTGHVAFASPEEDASQLTCLGASSPRRAEPAQRP